MTDQDKLAKLVLMLSSDRDGEVVAAARAIGRSLRAVGTDWHELARKLTVPAHSRRPPPHDADHGDANWRALRDFCLDRDFLLRPREREFVVGLGNWRGQVTEKQFAWLLSIYARVRRATGQ